MSGDSVVRIAVIGAGAIGRYHIPGFQQHRRARVVAVVDRSEERAREAARLFGVAEVGTDYAELASRDDIDAVSLAVPNHLHAEMAIRMLDAGKHVLCEKPMALCLAEAEAMAAAARRGGRVLMVGQNFRFHPETQRLRQCIVEGMLGEIYHARAYWLRRAGIPRIGSWFTRRAEAGGGCVCDIGVHFLDLVLYLMDAFAPLSVTGLLFQNFGPRGRGNGSWGLGEIDPALPFEVEDQAAALVRVAGGRSVILEVSWAAMAAEENLYGVDLFGREGGGHLFPARVFTSDDRGWRALEPATYTPQSPTERMVHFVDCVLGEAEPLCPVEQSLVIQRILDGVYESARTGREIRLDG